MLFYLRHLLGFLTYFFTRFQFPFMLKYWKQLVTSLAKPRATKLYGRVEVILHAFLISALL